MILQKLQGYNDLRGAADMTIFVTAVRFLVLIIGYIGTTARAGLMRAG
jgi:hypothetical protein